ncbi:unnamed protein product [Camellia sinensis]
MGMQVIDAFSEKQLALQPTIEEFEKNDLTFARNPYAGRSYVFSTLINTIVVFDNADGIWRHYDSLRPVKDCHNKHIEIAKEIRMIVQSSYTILSTNISTGNLCRNHFDQLSGSNFEQKSSVNSSMMKSDLENSSTTKC